MQNFWQANELGLVYSSPRILKEVGAHALSYHERYVRPSKVFVAKRTAAVKIALIDHVLSELEPSMASTISQNFDSISLPRAALAIFLKLDVCFSSILLSCFQGGVDNKTLGNLSRLMGQKANKRARKEVLLTGGKKKKGVLGRGHCKYKFLYFLFFYKGPAGRIFIIAPFF